MNGIEETDRQHGGPTCARELFEAPVGVCWSRLLDIEHVLEAVELTIPQKRAILASWLSDARAVPNIPSLRELDNGEIVKVDDLLKALRALDRIDKAADRCVPHPKFRMGARQGKLLPAYVKRAVRRNPFDGDDDPPPCAAAAVPVGMHLMAA